MSELEQFTKYLSYNPETGALIWIAKPSIRAIPGKDAGTVTRKGRKIIRLCGKRYFAHRIAWAMTYKKWPDGEIDHIDGNPLNNRLSNLRDVSTAINRQNIRAARADCESGFLGAHKFKKKWRARITVDGKQLALGVFQTPSEAHQAYVAAKRLYHPGCTL